jgi:virginiamycin A acetyltransferase
MKRSLVGRLVELAYSHLPAKSFLLRSAVKREGGQLTSVTLRRVLQRHHGVDVGPYSYGSLLTPGQADRGTSIGAYVSIGPGVRRLGANHPTDRLLMNPYAYNPALGLAQKSDDVERSSCRIEHEAWIGANSLILSRCVRIGVGAVVGAGSVVTRDVPDFAVVVGNPARQIATRLTAEQQSQVRALDLERVDPAGLVSLVRKLSQS